MAGATGRLKGQGAGELGWDQSMQGLKNMLEFGLYLRRSGSPLKAGEGYYQIYIYIYFFFFLKDNHISN